MRKLDQPIPIHFPEDTPLDEVLEHIKRATADVNFPGIPIYVDPRSGVSSFFQTREVGRVDLGGRPPRSTRPNYAVQSAQPGLRFTQCLGFRRTPTRIPHMAREGRTISRRAAGRPSAVAPRALATGLRRWVRNLSTTGRRSAVPAPYRLGERFGRSRPPMSPPQRQSTDARGHTSQDQRRRLRHVTNAEIVGLESGPGRAVI
jgi:hypothetical protein